MDAVTGLTLTLRVTHKAAYLGYKAAGLPYGDTEQGLYKWAQERLILAVTPGAVIAIDKSQKDGKQ